MSLNTGMTSAGELYDRGNGYINVCNSVGWDKDNELSIINLDPYGNGSHWTSMRKLKKGVYDFDDSFGCPPPMKNLKVKNSVIFYDPYQEQKVRETNCGARAFNSLFDKN